MRTARRLLCATLLPLAAAVSADAAMAAPAAPAPRAPAAAPVPAGPPRPIWEVQLRNFDRAIYEREIENLFVKFETETGRKIAPGPKRKVGLKIYTDSGPGLATPKGLVHGVIAALERRGFAEKDIFLVGLNYLRLRLTGYLPSPVMPQTEFEGHPLYVLESGRYYDPKWFYDSPLPNTFELLMKSQTEGVPNISSRDEDVKSFLATPLFLEADFWINLPSYSDHPVIGVNGALANASLWNASNTARFFRSPTSAPVAVAEMTAGIPELRNSWIFTIASLERYQFIDGPFFNSLYSVSEPLLWLSTDPVAMDAMMQDRMNRWRRREGFSPIAREIPTLINAELLGLGSTDTSPSRIVRVE